MILFPNAKINIGLDILRKRIDGFHDIETLFYPIQLSDILEINLGSQFSFLQTGISIEGDVETNLVVKAYRLLEKEFNLLPVQIHLHKIIPFGAGLGGGSSDAAFTLLGLNNIFHLNLGKDELLAYAAKLGSDCPFFILNQAVFAEDRGHVFSETNVSLKGYHLVLVKPEVHVPTALAYSRVTPQIGSISLKQRLNKRPEDWKNNVENGFETSVFQFYPEVENIKSTLYNHGAVYASMSGSGSSVFGIYKDKPQSLPKEFENYFVWEETLK